ncbi:SHOCT domain-containing protein [Texcoconibacillus texcoconensis]|uniref:Putative membrane protein n=1 Tax=Texcoconibacillus texcoconensis TaxID=1095777 RepID=A0A840QTM9_9BACI|nr:SHOCT domain-containing protein [Texcoconibacillus texcoconensis]MBB5174725.1 putative membrane protein [Texcoconibacillus texcoconensis]
MMMSGTYGFGGIFGMFLQVAFIIAVIYFVIYLFKTVLQPSQKNEANDQKGKASLEILEERFARGEIDEEEFKQKKKVLSESVYKS